MQSTVSKFRDENIIKIAVQFKNYPAQLIEFDQRESLSEIVQRLCSFPGWNCSPPSVKYALQYFESNCKNYVTEENRTFVKNGSILLLTYSALKCASDIIKALKTDSLKAKVNNLKKLRYVAKDLVFAVEFIKMDGLDLLLEFINSGNVTGEMLKYVLISFAELMRHEIVLWKSVKSLIIGRIIYFLDHEQSIIECILDVLDSLIRNNSDLQSIIDIKFDSLLLILEQSASDDAVKQKLISLINSLLQVANEVQKTKITDAFRTKKYRDVINISVMKKESMPNELNYQLYVFQTLMLSLIGKRMRTSFSENDDNAINSIRVLKQIAFDENQSEHCQTGNMERLYKSQSKMRDNLGFKSNVTIEQSFSVVPPGVLPLDCLKYFAENYSAVYKIMVSNLNQTVNDNYRFPLGEVAIELVKLLCNLFKIGEPPCEQTGKFHPIFFAHEHPFFELFCVCMEVLHRNWKEMRASKHDFIKVFSVTEDQILRTLNVRPLNFREFRRTIKTFPYSQINMFRELERAANEEYESTVPVVNLKQKLTPKIIDLVKKQRLKFLVTGSRFYEYTKTGQRVKNQIWYARLSANHKILHYDHCDEENTPTVDELHKQISVTNMKEILVGKECPGYHKRKNQIINSCSFAIFYLDQSSQPCATPLEFIAPDEVTQNYWVDGLRILLDLEMTSTRYNEDIDTLLAMEIKLRLLDTTGVGINKDTQNIPPDPKDYNF